MRYVIESRSGFREISAHSLTITESGALLFRDGTQCIYAVASGSWVSVERLPSTQGPISHGVSGTVDIT